MKVSAQAVAILVFSFRAPALKSLSARVLKHLPDRGRIGKTRGRKHRCISKKRWPEARVFRASQGSLPASPLFIRVPEVLARRRPICTGFRDACPKCPIGGNSGSDLVGAAAGM
mgnify:CR=1 FL=1